MNLIYPRGLPKEPMWYEYERVATVIYDINKQLADYPKYQTF